MPRELLDIVFDGFVARVAHERRRLSRTPSVRTRNAVQGAPSEGARNVEGIVDTPPTAMVETIWRAGDFGRKA